MIQLVDQDVQNHVWDVPDVVMAVATLVKEYVTHHVAPHVERRVLEPVMEP